MKLINSGMFTPAEIQYIKRLTEKILVKHPSDFLEYGFLTYDQLTKSLKDNGSWPHELFTEYFYQVAALDYWISKNQNHSLVNEARARLSAMSSVVVGMMSIKLNPEIVQSIQLPKVQPKNHGIAWFMEKYGSAINAIFGTKKRISFISMLFKKQGDTLSALDLAINVCEDFRKAEEKATIQVLIGQVVSIEESQRKTIEAVQQTIDAVINRRSNVDR